MNSTNSSPNNELHRDQYGAINLRETLSTESQSEVAAFLNTVVKAGMLPAPFIIHGKKELECLNLDIYDVLVFRGKVTSLIVQVRSYWKHLRKGYTKGGKDYYLVTRRGKKISVVSIDKSTCVKRAKSTTAVGQLVKHYLGKTTVPCKKAHIPVLTAYKVLAKTTEGRLVSAFDGSEYRINVWRSEAAKPDHGGGYYYYLDDTLAVNATRRGDTFAENKVTGKTLVLCEVEIKGRKIEYRDGKWAASQMRVISELRAVLLD